jgi:hypothetical protein
MLLGLVIIFPPVISSDSCTYVSQRPTVPTVYEGSSCVRALLCIFKNLQTTSSGGGLAIKREAAEGKVLDCVFAECVAVGGGGLSVGCNVVEVLRCCSFSCRATMMGDSWNVGSFPTIPPSDMGEM